MLGLNPKNYTSEIDFRSIIPGIYIVKIQTGQYVEYSKVIKY
ncbi:MAG: T9SS type A sorting domain-containing protein [Bacteroidetes bacterium]|nr:T9SS type A sorting domain-containing protein [Bacteroidota bacterium]